MPIFECLPKVKKCFCYIRLKVGSILIVCYIILCGVGIGIRVFIPDCKAESGFQKVTVGFEHVLFTIYLLLCITAVAFLFGILFSQPITATIFMYALLVTSVMQQIFGVTYYSAYLSSSKCEYGPINGLLYYVITGVFMLYFIIVINSYKSSHMIL